MSSFHLNLIECHLNIPSIALLQFSRHSYCTVAGVILSLVDTHAAAPSEVESLLLVPTGTYVTVLRSRYS